MRPRLLFVSNLFPSREEPYRGLDNATVLHHLLPRWDVRAVALRPALPWHRPIVNAREADAALQPVFVPVPYVPKLGGLCNHRLMARALRPRLQALRREWPWDAALCAWIFPDACAIGTLAGAEGWPWVAIAQGSDVHQYLQSPLRRRAIARELPGARAVITRSAELGRLLAGVGVSRERLHPIFNGVDHSTFHPGSRADARAALGWSTEDPVVLFVGNLVDIKNPDVLVRAHARLPGVRLVLAGGGPLEGALRRMAGELGTGDRVEFAGRLAAPEVARRMQAADLLCLPSRNEGVPNVILEAFASGLPVVASRVGGISEVHHEGCLGRLVPPGDPAALVDALQWTLTESVARDAIADHGRTFTWERAAREYDRILQSAMADS